MSRFGVQWLSSWFPNGSVFSLSSHSEGEQDFWGVSIIMTLLSFPPPQIPASKHHHIGSFISVCFYFEGFFFFFYFFPLFGLLCFLTLWIVYLVLWLNITRSNLESYYLCRYNDLFSYFFWVIFSCSLKSQAATYLNLLLPFFIKSIVMKIVFRWSMWLIIFKVTFATVLITEPFSSMNAFKNRIVSNTLDYLICSLISRKLHSIGLSTVVL